jgi:hypothetical protein
VTRNEHRERASAVALGEALRAQRLKVFFDLDAPTD